MRGGGNSNANLVLLNGVPINSFYYGGLFDFAHIPADAIDEVQVARGPQSAHLRILCAEQRREFSRRAPLKADRRWTSLQRVGTHAENRVSVSGETMLSPEGGESQRHSQTCLAMDPFKTAITAITTGFWRSISAGERRSFPSSAISIPIAWANRDLTGRTRSGCSPVSDLISRSKNNTSTYGVHYTDELSNSLRIDLLGGIFWNNSLYLSPFGTSFNKDLSGNAEARATYTLSKAWTVAGGFVFHREEMRNTYVNTTDGADFLLRRDDVSEYLENRLTFGHVYVNVGVRSETYQMPFVPGNAFGFPARPDFPASYGYGSQPETIGSVPGETRNAAAWILWHRHPASRRIGSRIHEQPGTAAGTYAQL